MPIPADRGYVRVTPDEGGTQTVEIATGIAGGKPRGVFAQHVRTASVVIDPGVALHSEGSARHTEDVVQVFTDAQGGVHLAPVAPLDGLG